MSKGIFAPTGRSIKLCNLWLTRLAWNIFSTIAVEKFGIAIGEEVMGFARVLEGASPSNGASWNNRNLENDLDVLTGYVLADCFSAMELIVLDSAPSTFAAPRSALFSMTAAGCRILLCSRLSA